MNVEPQFEVNAVLKTDLFGRIERGTAHTDGQTRPAVRRWTACAPLWLRPIAWYLATRETRALARLGTVEGVPHLLAARARGGALRTWIPGLPLHDAQPTDPAFYGEARRLLIRIHRQGITHNDTHKEPNWLVTEDGAPALVDFQLASRHRHRSRWFRLCAREDVRHLLKHKRKYCPDALTNRERAILRKKSWPARLWRRTVKKPYRWFTRRVLGWRDDEGRGMGQGGGGKGR
ncbi:MAG: serine/threonine protein kinase [Planctomycetes bacterium]|nr:serine/threonine protein kinase [Planctomycetota bacterium]